MLRMQTLYLLTISPPTSVNGSQPTTIMAATACMLVLVVFAVVLVVVLRYRVVDLATRMSVREQAISKLAAELEAQALLARQMSVDLEELRHRLLCREETMQAAPATAWSNPALPMNLNRRGQILRLSRKGKSVAEIASDLHVAQGEVELLLKVHDLGQKTATLEH
jgi:uncharacterized coiled-coil protein SlyX